MNPAAPAALPLTRLPKIPCTTTGIRTSRDRNGWVDEQRCTLPDGHEELGHPHRWQWVSWHEELVTPLVDPNEDF